MAKQIAKIFFMGALLLGVAMPSFADPIVDAINNTWGTGPGPADLSREQSVSALINYDAAARALERQYQQQLLFMPAPGSNWALQGAEGIASSDIATTALALSNSSLVNTLGPLTNATQLTLNGIGYPVKSTAGGALQFFQVMEKFITSGDTSNIARVNLAAIMQIDNLLEAKPTPITQEQAQQLINLLTNPFPQVDTYLRDKIKNGGELTGAEMERLGTLLAQYANLGVSVNAFSDIVARRLPNEGKTQSMMQIMDRQSSARFTDPNWYNELSSASDSAILREIAHMMAFNTWVAYEQFRISEAQLSVIASFNAVMAKFNAQLDLLSKQLQAAQSQAQAAQQQLQQQTP